MPHISTPDPFTATEVGINPCFLGNQKPSIVCIATHAYRQRRTQKKEQEYATSFMRTEDYIASLREEVDDAVFRDSIAENRGTPMYVFDEINGIYHSPKHPLIQKGLLASTKSAQYRGHDVRPRKEWPSGKPKPLPASRSFYRPNSTHNYLTKTITLGGSHDGFNPKHGTPTRAQLLRNRVRFSSAPDLTYSYLAQKRPDGKQEAVHRKNKAEEELLQLKASKIEMDRTAAKYRKFMIGSQYNTAKWIDSHVTLVHDLIAVKNRPASSVTPKTAPASVHPKRRAISAVANQEHLRKAANQSEHTPHTEEAESQSVVNLAKKKTFPTPSYKRKPTKIGPDCNSDRVRAPNLVPYSASVNSPSCNDHFDSSFIVKSVQESQDVRQVREISRRLELAKQLRVKIETAAANHYKESTSPDVIGSPVLFSIKPTKLAKQRMTEQSAEDSSPFFVTNPPNTEQPIITRSESEAASHRMPMNAKVSTDLDIDTIDELTIGGTGFTEPIVAQQNTYRQGKESSATLSSQTLAEEGKFTGNEKLKVSASRPHSVSVELPVPTMENVSDNTSLTFEFIEDAAIDVVRSAQPDGEIVKDDNHLAVTVENGGSLFANDITSNSEFIDKISQQADNAEETITPLDGIPDMSHNGLRGERESSASVDIPDTKL